MNVWWYGFLVIGGTTFLAVSGMLLVRRHFGLERLKHNHEVAGYLLSVIGTLYAVLLGLVVVDAQTNVQAARVVVEAEANSLVDIFRFASAFPEKNANEIQRLCLEYADLVLSDDWPSMQTQRPSHALAGVVDKLWGAMKTTEPVSQSQQGFYSVMLNEMTNLADNRRARWIRSHSAVSPVVWVALVVGAIATIVFTYFFGTANIRSQILMTVLVSVTLSLNVFIVAVFNNPFVGELTVQPESFQLDHDLFVSQLKGYYPPAAHNK